MSAPPQSDARPRGLEDATPQRDETRAQGSQAWRGRLSRFVRRRKISSRERLSLLIKVFAGFTQADGVLEQREIDSILGFLRYDYPKAVYSELREEFKSALREPQRPTRIARQLAGQLTTDEKVHLGLQLYILLARSGQDQQLELFYHFMTELEVAREAIDLVYQLNRDPEAEACELPSLDPSSDSTQLQTLRIACCGGADVELPSLEKDEELTAFRVHNLVILKNTGEKTVIAQGRELRPGAFGRIYEGQRALLGDTVMTYGDLDFYFNAAKGVASTRIYLSYSANGHFVAKTRSKTSELELTFGLDVTLRVLRPTSIRLNQQKLQPGQRLPASLEDKLRFADQTEVPLGDLRRRGRELGGRFPLKASKAEYLVSNNPSLLEPGDILLSPDFGGDLLLRITCNYQEKKGTLSILQSPRPLYLEGQAIRFRTDLADGDTIVLGEGHYLRVHYSDQTIEEERNIIRRLEVSELSHRYQARETALDSLSFSVRRGEMIGVIGPSGCGKSTLLRVLAAQLKPSSGKVLLNGYSLYRHRLNLAPYIAFMPHEESFDPLLTVQENLRAAAAIRAAHQPGRERRRRVEGKLTELGLAERRDRLVGDPARKSLSGGERKRLNIGLDLIGMADVYLFDEATSGLSSKDSEHVLEIISGISHNKITFVSLHQPGLKLFRMFHKILVLDKGGKMAFFGQPEEALGYFQQAAEEENLALESGGTERSAFLPDNIFDVLEYPLRDLGGDIIYDRDESGHLVPARRFTPESWRDRFQAREVTQEAQKSTEARDESGRPERDALPRPSALHLWDEVVHLRTHFLRSFHSKLRNRSNLITTLLEAPLLAALIAWALRYSEADTYNFQDAFHIPTYLFLSLVVAMFLGMTNSADEIIRDRPILLRERNHHPRLSYYLASKFAVLALFAVLQCLIYLLVGNAILGIRGMLGPHLLWMSGSALAGIGVGLLVSSIVKDGKTALNIIPLVLIPQIILGGALIKYEEMNRSLQALPSFTQWTGHRSQDVASELEVPLLCEFMPLRWAYEGLLLTQAESNPLQSQLAQVSREIDRLTAIPLGDMTEEELQQLRQYKDARVLLYSLEARDAQALDEKMATILPRAARGQLQPGDYRATPGDPTVSAEELYLNEKVGNLFDKAEMERLDRTRDQQPNVFFGREKTYFDQVLPTRTANTLALLLFPTLSLLLAFVRLVYLNRVT
ncbi:MAG: ATP-binding cassette domain-containing protein [Verrucomicrobiota bacterium]